MRRGDTTHLFFRLIVTLVQFVEPEVPVIFHVNVGVEPAGGRLHQLRGRHRCSGVQDQSEGACFVLSVSCQAGGTDGLSADSVSCCRLPTNSTQQGDPSEHASDALPTHKKTTQELVI